MITNDNAADERGGPATASTACSCRAVADGTARSGIPAWTPDTDDLAAAIERLGDDELRAELAGGARRVRERRAQLVAHGGWPSRAAGERGLMQGPQGRLESEQPRRRRRSWSA